MNVKERFLKYVTFETTSDEHSTTTPSSPCQLVLGEYLVKEMCDIGLSGCHMDENGYVYGYIPASNGCEDKPCIGFIAHIDTTPDVSGKNVAPQCISYAGGDICLGNGEKMLAKDFTCLKSYVGQELIVTDGNTLLGSDDKAGIAEIMAACEYIIAHPEIKHGRIAVAFTPDEEIGSGADLLDLEKFGAQWAYTVDGGALGEIEYENFNAASAVIKVKGVAIHPGSAKDKMKNAILMANEFINMLPGFETPAHTEGYEGFYHVCDFMGNESTVEFAMIIRDHDMEKFLARKARVESITAYLNGVYGEGSFSAEIKDSYYNMREKILPHMHIVESAESAMNKVGVTPKIVAIRGGTDGARLSFRGLPCPNLSTGGENFHSIHEFIPTKALEKMTEVVVELMKCE